MLTEKEREIFQNKVYLLYRYGKLGLRSAFNGILSCFGSEFRTSDIDLSASDVYFGLYNEPQEMVSCLFYSKLLGFRDAVSHFTALVKYHLSRELITPPPAPYVPEIGEILDFFESMVRDGKLSLKHQIMLVEVIGDRLHNSFLFKSDESENAKKRLDCLLELISPEAFTKSRSDTYFCHFLISEKFRGKSSSIQKVCDKLIVSYGDSKFCIPFEAVRCRVHKIQRTKNGIRILLEITCPVFIHIPFSGIKLTAIINDNIKIPLSLSKSSACYHNSFEKTASAYFAEIVIDPESTEKMAFSVNIGGYDVSALCYADSSVFYAGCLNGDGYSIGDKVINLEKGCLFFNNRTAIFDKCTDPIAKKAFELKSNRIWLYSDYSSVKYDNGYFQFVHDFEKDDGIKRYYIAHPEQCQYIANEYKDSLIIFGSDEHKALFLAAEKIFAAFVDAPNSVIPYEISEYPQYSAIFGAEIIYLQHGVLHAHIPWRYSPASTTFHADRIVVSSGFEVENFTKNYYFSKDSLIPCGMPRYDRIPKERRKNNKILYAPSWRAYMDDKMTERFMRQVGELLSSEKLEGFLAENDIYLDFKPHPLFMKYSDKLRIFNDRVRIVSDAAPEEYLIFITDFSSYVFDFVYLGIPVVYYFPDYDNFRRGCYQYKNLDIPFEKAFGKLTANADDAVEELNIIAKSGYEPQKIYNDRMKSFFLPLENCCEKLYNAEYRRNI